jgi:serine/threonine protein kinase
MLPPGTRLGPYEVVGLIGEGGMGQVYRARDTRLDREVAIKMLPASLAGDAVRRERFEREARTISRLEHPHICSLYDVGEYRPPESANGAAAEPPALYIVMPLLEGETLAQRLGRGPLSIAQTLDYGIQIAEALATAHRAGIVHRDLKPGNVMLTRAGAQLLDFGLARDVIPPEKPGATVADLTAGRTLLTTEGTVLGTLHYMSPEQLDGRQVDTRADIFAFGAVLFEMVTGLKAFDAESPARVMSAILRDEPTRVSAIVPITPAGLDALIHTCLAKDPNDRWQGLSDVARQLRWLQSSLSAGRSQSTVLPPGVVPSSAPTHRWRTLVLASAALATAMAAGAAAAWWLANAGRVTAPPRRLHASILAPENRFLTSGLALSPDGSLLAFIAADASGERQLWLRPLDAAVARPMTGTEGASDPFWSPSGSDVAFFADNKLKRVPAQGGPPVVIVDAGAGAGGSWNRSDEIVFQPFQQGPLLRVAAGGGQPAPATRLDAANDETHHLYPAFLPDGRHFVFYVAGKRRGLHVGSLDEPAHTWLLDPDPALPAGAAATPGVYVGSGHLLYVRDRVLMARPFDADARRVSGEAIKLVDTVDYEPPGMAAFAVSSGLLVYRPRQHLPTASLAWVDRRGDDQSTIAAPPGTFRQLSLSPDDRFLALDRRDAQGLSSVWVLDLARGLSSRVPAAYWSGDPLWSPDGRQLAYSIAADSPPNLAVRDHAPGGAERRLTKDATIQYASGWTPDGRSLVFRAYSNDTGWDLHLTPVDGAGAPARLLQTRANESGGQVSPDGRWVAYTSDDSGRTEAYVSRFPEMSGRVAVSTRGGLRPMWRRDGRELYFVAPGGSLMAARFDPASGKVDPPAELFKTMLYLGLYAPATDGQRFLIARPAAFAEQVSLELIVDPLR